MDLPALMEIKSQSQRSFVSLKTTEVYLIGFKFFLISPAQLHKLISTSFILKKQ